MLGFSLQKHLNREELFNFWIYLRARESKWVIIIERFLESRVNFSYLFWRACGVDNYFKQSGLRKTIGFKTPGFHVHEMLSLTFRKQC